MGEIKNQRKNVEEEDDEENMQLQYNAYTPLVLGPLIRALSTVLLTLKLFPNAYV